MSDAPPVCELIARAERGYRARNAEREAAENWTLSHGPHAARVVAFKRLHSSTVRTATAATVAEMGEPRYLQHRTGNTNGEPWTVNLDAAMWFGIEGLVRWLLSQPGAGEEDAIALRACFGRWKVIEIAKRSEASTRGDRV